jgi:hypothetical protein
MGVSPQVENLRSSYFAYERHENGLIARFGWSEILLHNDLEEPLDCGRPSRRPPGNAGSVPTIPVFIRPRVFWCFFSQSQVGSRLLIGQAETNVVDLKPAMTLIAGNSAAISISRRTVSATTDVI